MNHEERPLGPKVTFQPVQVPPKVPLAGRYVQLEPLQPDVHGPALWPQIVDAPQDWDYLFEPAPADAATLVSYLEAAQSKPDWQGYAIRLPERAVVGYAFYLNIVPGQGTIEVGNINFFAPLAAHAGGDGSHVSDDGPCLWAWVSAL